MLKLIHNTKVIFRDEIVDAAVLFSEKIEQVFIDCTPNKISKLKKENKKLEIIDGENNFLSPGFIDIHIHGSAGYDTMDASLESLKNIKNSLIRSGVTSFLATTMTMSRDNIRNALSNVRDLINKKESPGASIIGVHLEGPFISKEFKGCHIAKDIISPDLKLIEEYKDIIKLITIAPELEGIKELINYLKENNIIASAGHTGASYEEVIAAFSQGLSHVTHLFNAMEKLHHREPGLIGAALSTDTTVELIADFIHVHPAVIKIVLQAKNSNDIILVTDAMRAASMEDGEYDLGGQKVIVKEGTARLENGRLAGSVLTLDQAIRNINKISNLPLDKIIKMVTYNPARILGMEDKIGCIKEGNIADFVFLNQDLEVVKVFKGGELEYIK
ncbi:N-acetylglucosamine-6-phosphate deacetylase [Natronospora cellulosivora (SeqCode)]